MLALPLLLGLVVTGARSTAAWFVIPAALLAFLSHNALIPVLQRVREGKPRPADWRRRRVVWGSLYLAGAGAAFAAAVALAPAAGRAALLGIAAAATLAAAIYAAASVLGAGRAIVSEVIGMAGMALAAPMMAAASGRPLDRASFGAAAICLGYFLSSLTFVRSYESLRTAASLAVPACVAIHAVLAAGLVALDLAGGLPRGWWIPFVPVGARTAWGLARPPVNLRALGMRELAVASSFAVLAAWVVAE